MANEPQRSLQQGHSVPLQVRSQLLSRLLGRLPRTGLSRSVADQLTRMILQNSPRVILPTFISSSLCYVLILKSGLVVAATCWFVLTMTATIARVFGLRKLVRYSDEDPTNKLFATSMLSLFTGLSCGSLILFFPFVGAFERAMLTAMLLSFCSGLQCVCAFSGGFRAPGTA